MKNISNAELEVLNVIWRKEKATSKEIIKELNTKNWNDNTIRTLITRLINKKAIGICDKKGKIYTYIPLIKKYEYQNYICKKLINQFFDGSLFKLIEFLNESNSNKK